MTDPLAPWLAGFAVPAGARRVVAGCSGGPDSTALLALATASGLDAVAVHVDHGLRAGSEADAGVVEAVARRLGVEAVSVAVQVAPGPGLEARARDARLAALEAQRASREADAVLLGHTRDDQAETVLLNLLRGSAAAGLGGIPPVRDRVVHPILALSRADTEEICARLGLATVTDPMNDDLSFRRVWLRREVIPLLEAGTGRDLRPLLARQAEVLRSESDFLDALARQELAAAGSAPGEPTLDARALAGLHPVLARRVVRVWLGPPPPSLAQVDRVLAVARGECRAAELSGGTRVSRSRGVLHVGACATVRP